MVLGDPVGVGFAVPSFGVNGVGVLFPCKMSVLQFLI